MSEPATETADINLDDVAQLQAFVAKQRALGRPVGFTVDLDDPPDVTELLELLAPYTGGQSITMYACVLGPFLTDVQVCSDEYNARRKAQIYGGEAYAAVCVSIAWANGSEYRTDWRRLEPDHINRLGPGYLD